MGRASREQAGRNRERVVETACRLFRRHGAENLSIADIMSAAGLTTGGFYKQFRSREALVEEAFALAFRQSSSTWAQVREGADPEAPRALAALVQHYFEDLPPEENCPMLAFASTVSEVTPDSGARQIYGSGAEELFSQFRQAARSASEHESDESQPEADVMLLFAAMIGTGMLTRAAGSTPWTRAMQSAVLGALPGPAAGE